MNRAQHNLIRAYKADLRKRLAREGKLKRANDHLEGQHNWDEWVRTMGVNDGMGIGLALLRSYIKLGKKGVRAE